jgi:hypothetical protein
MKNMDPVENAVFIGGCRGRDHMVVGFTSCRTETEKRKILYGLGYGA